MLDFKFVRRLDLISKYSYDSLVIPDWWRSKLVLIAMVGMVALSENMNKNIYGKWHTMYIFMKKKLIYCRFTNLWKYYEKIVQ